MRSPAVLVCTDHVGDEDLFHPVMLNSDVDVSPELADEVRPATLPTVQQTEATVMTLGTTLMFDGGVTVEWVMQRLREWDAMTWEARKTSRKRKGAKGAKTGEKVH